MAYHRYVFDEKSDRGTLMARLVEVSEQLANAHYEMASVAQAEKQLKSNAFNDSGETTVAGKERYAEAVAMDMTCAVFDVRAQIAALSEERDCIITLLEAS